MAPTELKIESFATDRPRATAPERDPVDDARAASEPSRGTVLIVDDEPAIVALLGEFLDIQGYTAISAGGGLEALARLEADRPDAVLLDVRMPVIDGIETLRRIAALNTGVPVLMVSANDDVVLAKQAIALGAFDYILKPVDFNYLSRALERMIRGNAPPIDVAGQLTT